VKNIGELELKDVDILRTNIKASVDGSLIDVYMVPVRVNYAVEDMGIIRHLDILSVKYSENDVVGNLGKAVRSIEMHNAPIVEVRSGGTPVKIHRDWRAIIFKGGASYDLYLR